MRPAARIRKGWTHRSVAEALSESRFRPGTAAVGTMRELAGGLLLLVSVLVPATVNAQTTLSASPTSVITNGTVTATWSGIPAPSTSNWIGLFNPGTPSTTFYLYSSVSTNGAASGSVPMILPWFANPGTYELRLFSSGNTLLATSNTFTVVAPPSVSGSASLNGAGLTGVVYTATNGVTCTSLTNSSQYSCSVPLGWSGSVTPARGGVSFTPASRDYTNVTASQTVQDYLATSTSTLSVSETSAIVGSTVTATWTGTPGPADGNRLGLFKPGDPSTGFYLYSSASVSGLTSGSMQFTLPTAATPGTYELRLLSNGGYTVLAISNSFTIVAPPSISGTASLNGAGLTGVVYTATNGVTCTSLTNSSQYSCTVPVGWSGSVTPARGGVSFTPASRDYSNVTASQTAQDYPATSTSTLSVNPTSAIVGSTVTATWTGTPGPADGNWLGLYKPGDPSTAFYLYSSVSVSGQTSGSIPFPLPAAATPGTYELRLFSSLTSAPLAISNPFTVVAPPSVSGTAGLNGTALAGVVFTATNGVTCTSSNSFGQYSCTVPVGWSGSVTPSRGGVSFTPASRDYSNVTASQTAQDYPATSTSTLSVNPTSAIVGSAVTATWTGTPGPADGNWLGLFNPGAPNLTSYLYSSASVSGQTSGSLPFTLPAFANPGTYELRLFSGGTSAPLAISNPFTVSSPVSVSGTVTAGGSPLSGVAIAATNGGTCTSSDASGQYSCTAPQGWSGSVTPTLSGYNFTPASRSYTALQANQTGQDFVGNAVGAMEIYYIVPDHLNTPRLIADQAGNTVWRNDNAEPFGDSVPNGDPNNTGVVFDFPLRFPGQYFDRETNLAYNYYRDYDPAIGRYIQSDPIGLYGGLNTYAYVSGSPLNLADPQGLASRGGALGKGYSGTVGGIAGKKCADNISCDWYLRAPPYLLDTATHDQCAWLITSGSLGHNYLECRDACLFWLKQNCTPPKSCGPTGSDV